ncbi:enoyl-CoA hydratase [Pseudonocardia ailaonensis]|uniref:Enoyl-CoA hydratase n=1 Tax=Pseudonocardia ailaonensis TaxID=367279 RepID=A0ABN2N4X1_9PSEU
MSGYQWITCETVDEGRICVISLDRPRQRNAQHRGLLVELGEAMRRAEEDDDVRVVVLRGNGPSFSAGHDIGSREGRAERADGPERHPSFDLNGATKEPVERNWRQEWHYFFENTRRWRDLQKITVASVQGPVVSAGLMLMWACDLIVAEEGATFSDVVGTRMGMPGVEYFAHPWELGPRRAKELLLTGDKIDAVTAYEWGMVSRVFPAGTLQERTLTFARRIAELPTTAALLIKESVNQAVDAQGFQVALKAAFTLHELGHAHWMVSQNNSRAIVRLPPGGLWSTGETTTRSRDEV